MTRENSRKPFFSSRLTKEQKARFQSSYPQKVYRTEQTISIIVAATQLLMLITVLLQSGGSVFSVLANPYFVLYAFLFIATLAILPVYIRTVHRERYHSLLWIKRIYILLLCTWMMGITLLDLRHGVGLGVYCYLLPTLAAVLLITPAECMIIYGAQWILLMVLLVLNGLDSGVVFSSGINSLFATVLAVFISIRYYRSMETEFYDTETIKAQYAEIQKANEALSRMAYTDQLTGLYNRRYLSEKVLPDFATCKEPDRFMEVLMLDIDFFKQYNDRYGHIQGDDCLRKISSVILSCLQEKNAAAIRYGGEEFLVLRTFTSDREKSLADSIQEAIHLEKIPRSDTEKPFVTMSIGIWRGGMQEAEDLEKLISRADEALYEAKASGRDCIRRAKKV